MNSRRTIIATGAVPLLAGLAISAAIGTSSEAVVAASNRTGSLWSALGFALCGLGLLALTRKRDRGSVLARSTSALLALLAIAGLTVAGLHAVAVSAQASATPATRSFLLFGPECDLLLSLGYLATAVAVTALTLTGRKRAGAAVAAALAFTITLIGMSSLIGAALGLQHTNTPFFYTLLTATLFPVIGLGLAVTAVGLQAAVVGFTVLCGVAALLLAAVSLRVARKG